MATPIIFKIAQTAPGTPGISALQAGLHNFIWTCRSLLQDTSEDVTGLYGYFKTYLNNLEATYPQGITINGKLDDATLDNFIVLRDKVTKRLATRNLADDIKKYADQPWYKTVVYWGEQVMALFQPVSQLMSTIKEDSASLEQHGMAVGQALTRATDQLLKLTRQFMRAQEASKGRKPITASKINERIKKLDSFIIK
jgi:hypothetical protein